MGGQAGRKTRQILLATKILASRSNSFSYTKTHLNTIRNIHTDTYEFLRFSHKKITLFLIHFYIEKKHAVSAVTLSVARILQWGVENDFTIDYTLHTGADPESFGGVYVILN